MAEGWAKHFKPDSIEAYSAGIEKHGLNPLAVLAMKEAGEEAMAHYRRVGDEIRAYIEQFPESLTEEE